jgi:hypothetical protein
MDENQRGAVFEYLEVLRDSGVTNMLGAVPYLMDQFGFTKDEARCWLAEWIKSFQED